MSATLDVARYWCALDGYLYEQRTVVAALRWAHGCAGVRVVYGTPDGYRVVLDNAGSDYGPTYAATGRVLVRRKVRRPEPVLSVDHLPTLRDYQREARAAIKAAQR